MRFIDQLRITVSMNSNRNEWVADSVRSSIKSEIRLFANSNDLIAKILDQDFMKKILQIRCLIETCTWYRHKLFGVELYLLSSI